MDQKWLDMGMCEMHARLLHMFSNLKTQGYWCKMDNLFNSVKLSLEDYSLWARFLIHGVIQKIMWGVPLCVLQEELTAKRADAARRTVKSSVLEGGS